MARDGLFFRWLDHVHPRFRTPSRAVLAHCVWAAVILLVRGSFETIVTGMVFAVLIFYSMTTLALFKLRREDRGQGDIFRMPLYPLLPVVYLAGIVCLLVARAILSWRTSLIDLAFVASGLPFSIFWLSRRNARTAQPITPTISSHAPDL
jgi:APA family basic amino acid/polyamine antiporter